MLFADGRKAMKVSEALKEIAEELRKLSGYPDHTTEDFGKAFAYGMLIGSAWALEREYKDKEEAFDKQAKASGPPSCRKDPITGVVTCD